MQQVGQGPMDGACMRLCLPFRSCFSRMCVLQRVSCVREQETAKKSRLNRTNKFKAPFRLHSFLRGERNVNGGSSVIIEPSRYCRSSTTRTPGNMWRNTLVADYFFQGRSREGAFFCFCFHCSCACRTNKRPDQLPPNTNCELRTGRAFSLMIERKNKWVRRQTDKM
jgi:hypothetical protein